MVRELKPDEQIFDASGNDITTLSAGDVLSQAYDNFGASAGQAAEDFFAPFLSPIQTAKSVYELGKGVVNLAIPGEDPSEETARAVGEYFANRYGGFEEIKRTMATDPAGFLLDASTVLTGGGAAAARAPGIVGKVGRAAMKADPLVASAKAAKKYVPQSIKNIPGKIGTTLVGDVATRTGGESVSQAFQAGKAGGKRGEAFLANMRGDAAMSDVVEQAKDAVAQLKMQKNDLYQKQMAEVGKATEAIDFADIDKAISKSVGKYTVRGRDISGAGDAINDVNKIVNEYKMLPEMHDAIGMDAMKQEIYNRVISKLDPKDAAYGATMGVYRAIGNTINQKAPIYRKAMSDYSKAAAEINDIERTLSLKPNANIDTSVRKLQSIFRNNANTDYGRRAELGARLEQAGADTLLPALAGQSMSSVAPRGIGGAVLPMLQLGASAATMNPIPAMMLPFQSPRLMGEAAYGAGRAANMASKVPPGVAYGGGLGAFQAGRIPGLLEEE